MESIRLTFSELDGVDLKVEAEINDIFMNLNHTGFSYAKIINSSIHCRFVGSPPYVFKPGMPYHGAVSQWKTYCFYFTTKQSYVFRSLFPTTIFNL